MKTRVITLTAMAIGPMCLMTAIAQPTAVETFNYPDGSGLSGLNGGTGWSSAWADNGKGTPTVNSGVLGGLGTGGGYAWRYFSSPVSITPNLTYYFRADLGYNDPVGYWSVDLTDGSGNIISKLVLEHTWATSTIGTTAFTGPTIGYPADGTMETLIGKLQWDSADANLSISAWVTPASGPISATEAGAGSPTWIQTGLAPATDGKGIGGVTLENWGQNTSVMGDNLYFGSTWADVAPAPEPGTLALLGLGGLLFVRRSRQSNQ